MILYVNIPDDIKRVINNSGKHYKDNSIFVMNDNIKKIYINIVNNIYKNQSFKIGDHSYIPTEDMYGAINILENNGEKISIFLNDDTFNINNYFNNDIIMNNILQGNLSNNYNTYDENDFLRLQIELKNEVNSFLKNNFLRILNKTRR